MNEEILVGIGIFDGREWISVHRDITLKGMWMNQYGCPAATFVAEFVKASGVECRMVFESDLAKDWWESIKVLNPTLSQNLSSGSAPSTDHATSPETDSSKNNPG